MAHRGKMILVIIALGMGAGSFPAHADTTCQEDMVCWDWRTMGNHCHGVDNGLIECYTVDDNGDLIGDLYEP